MAHGLNRPVPPICERVYSISFESDGTLWSATVGSRLKGRKKIVVKGNADWGLWFEDPALVLAIFPPAPYVIVTVPHENSHFRGDEIGATPIGIELFFQPSRQRLPKDPTKS
jgi:hypothetical protein